MPKVLLADDSATMQKVVDLVLKDHGFQVRAASNGNEAVKIADEFAPDIVLAFIRLPQLNGYQLCEKLKAHPKTKSTPVILLAGAFDPVDPNLMSKCGADGSLVKPFQSDDLLKTIKQFIKAEAQAAPVAEDEIVFAADESPDFGPADKTVTTTEMPVDPFAAPAEAEPSMAVVAEEGEVVAEAVAEEDLWGFDGSEAAVVEAVAEEAGYAAEPVEEVAAVVAEAEPEPEPAPVAPAPKPQPAARPAAPAPSAAAASAAAVSVSLSPEDMKAALVGAMPTKEELTNVYGRAVQGIMSEAIASMDLKDALIKAIEPQVRTHIEKIIYDLAPELIEKILKETITEGLSAVNKELENIIWETVPELAETIITRELEKIRSAST